MDTAQSPETNDSPVPPSVHCRDCHTALASPSRQSVSYLLLDQYTVPLLGCDEHLEQFRSICELTTEGSADLLSHLPAGGVRCPSCRLTARAANHVLIPVKGGATVVLGCPEHQSSIAARFETGLETLQQLETSVRPSETQSI